jgi:hypothetical protein
VHSGIVDVFLLHAHLTTRAEGGVAQGEQFTSGIHGHHAQARHHVAVDDIDVAVSTAMGGAYDRDLWCQRNADGGGMHQAAFLLEGSRWRPPGAS